MLSLFGHHRTHCDKYNPEDQDDGLLHKLGSLKYQSHKRCILSRIFYIIWLTHHPHSLTDMNMLVDPSFDYQSKWCIHQVVLPNTNRSCIHIVCR
jgi:hypothetical protein